MKIEKQTSEGMQKIADLIDGVGPGMLTTRSPDTDKLGSRPMHPLAMDAQGSLWFFTQAQADKEAPYGDLNLSFAHPDKGTYVSLSGSATLLDDREKIDALWSPMAKPWFPEGKDDPSLRLLRVDVHEAEYWDSSSSKMVRLLAMAASIVAGKPIGLGDNEVVRNPS